MIYMDHRRLRERRRTRRGLGIRKKVILKYRAIYCSSILHFDSHAQENDAHCNKCITQASWSIHGELGAGAGWCVWTNLFGPVCFVFGAP